MLCVSLEQGMKSFFLLLVLIARFEPIRSAFTIINHGACCHVATTKSSCRIKNAARSFCCTPTFLRNQQFTLNHLKSSKNDNNSNNEEIGIDYLKIELTQYLAKRKELNADEVAKL